MRVFACTAILLIFPVFLSADISRLKPSETITISAVGDIMMGTTYPSSLLPEENGRNIFDGISSEFRGRDIIFGNLEGPLIDGGRPSKCGNMPNKDNCIEFRTPTSYAMILKNAGFNVMNIANNHSRDFGDEGLRSTFSALTALGIKPIGGIEIGHLTIKNRRIAVVGFSSGDSRYSFPISDIEGARKIIRALKAKNDIVIVSFHGGAEGSGATRVRGETETFLGENRGNVKSFARSVIDAGADLVLGHGPHVPRAVEIYNNRLIAYSLGNFLTYGKFNIKGSSGLSIVLKVTLSAETGEFEAGGIVAVKLKGKGIPVPDYSLKAVKLIESLSREDVKGGGIIFGGEG